jgi:hypothetical protein
MIAVHDYFKQYEGHAEITGEMITRAQVMLAKVNELLERAVELGWQPQKNGYTGNLISGQKNGGWRPQACTIGAPGSSHKQARGVDVCDPDDALDDLLTDELLEEFGLYREHPDDTPHWCHLTDKAPGSGRRTFKP